MTGKLNSRQIALMIIMSRISDMGLFLPVLTTGSAKQDAWISVIIGTLAGMAIGLAIAGLAVRLRDLSFGMGAKRLLGPALGTAAGLAVGLFLYFILLTVLRMFSLCWGYFLQYSQLGNLKHLASHCHIRGANGSGFIGKSSGITFDFCKYCYSCSIPSVDYHRTRHVGFGIA